MYFHTPDLEWILFKNTDVSDEVMFPEDDVARQTSPHARVIRTRQWTGTFAWNKRWREPVGGWSESRERDGSGQGGWNDCQRPLDQRHVISTPLIFPFYSTLENVNWDTKRRYENEAEVMQWTRWERYEWSRGRNGWKIGRKCIARKGVGARSGCGRGLRERENFEIYRL